MNCSGSLFGLLPRYLQDNKNLINTFKDLYFTVSFRLISIKGKKQRICMNSDKTILPSTV